MNFALENDTKKIIKLAVLTITDTVDFYKEYITTTKKTHEMQEQGHENADSVDSQVCEILESSNDDMEFEYKEKKYFVKIVGKDEKRSFGDIYAEIYVKETNDMFFTFPINTKVTFDDEKGQPNLAAFNRIKKHCIDGSFHYFVFIVDCSLRKNNDDAPISVYCLSVPYLMNKEPLKYITFNAGPGQTMLNKAKIHELRMNTNEKVLFDENMSFIGFEKVLNLYVTKKIQEHIELRTKQMEKHTKEIMEHTDKFY